MNVQQIYELTNTIAQELLGESAIVNEDLSNLVALGDQFQNIVGLDNYVKSLTDHIGRMIFVNRQYQGRAPQVLMDGWEFGSILEKVSVDLPEATENESWKLVDGQSYDSNIFYEPKATVTFWNNKVTFEIPISITELQVKSAFQNINQYNAFISTIYTAIDNSMTLRLDGLIMRTINNFIGETVYADYTGTDITTKSGVKAVNLLYLYNNKDGTPAGTPLTADKALTDPDFIKFAVLKMKNYESYIGDFSTLFNIGGKERFTPSDRLHWVCLSEFINSANVYLQSDTFNEEYTRLPYADKVTCWQGTGTAFNFSDTSSINIKTSGEHTVEVSGILGVMFDRDSLGVTNMNRRVTNTWVPRGEFWNQWFKMDAGYFNDQNENFVVFFIA